MSFLKKAAIGALVAIACSFPLSFRLQAQNLDCLEFQDYIPSCDAITVQDHCSPQLVDLCCRCQAMWGTNFDFCSYQSSLFPTPTPTPAATPTLIPTPNSTATAVPEPTLSARETPMGEPTVSPTPLPPQSPDVRCEVSLVTDESQCENGLESFIFDGSASWALKGQKLAYSWTVDCGSQATSLAPHLIDPNRSPGTPPAGARAQLKLAEPLPAQDIRCDVVLSVSARIRGVTQVSSCLASTYVDQCRLGCRSVWIAPVLTAMDGSSRAQYRAIRRIVGRMPAHLQRSKGVRKLVAAAREAHSRAWTAAWSFPKLARTCSDTTICVKASLSPNRIAYESESKNLQNLGMRAVDMLVENSSKHRARGKGLRWQKLVARYYQASRDIVKEAPVDQSVCR